MYILFQALNLNISNFVAKKLDFRHSFAENKTAEAVEKNLFERCFDLFILLSICKKHAKRLDILHTASLTKKQKNKKKQNGK